MPPAREEEFRGTERFVVQRRLGEGSFGVVYQAMDRESGRPVAVKTLRDGNVEALYRLKREFRALADIVHPNLVRLHELLAHEERWFFTMELIEGVNFLQHVAGQQPAEIVLPDTPTAPSPAAAREAFTPPVSRHSGRPDRIRAALRQAVSGLQALHRAGQLHRDIKPSNVLVTREGRLILLDFGLAADLSVSASGSSRRSVSIVGTPAYMSPEQGSGDRVSEATDWYSLGVMLFEALTGRWPFTGSFVEMMWDKRHTPAPAPKDLVPDVPEDLNALCRDLLRSEPSRRPDGDEVLKRLGGIQNATWEPRSVRPTSSERKAPFVGRESELARLRSAFEAARKGRAVVARLHGPSGAGKSALARHFVAEARASGAIVLEGRCYARESVPYKALDSLVDALSQFLKKLPAERVRDYLPRDVQALARLFPVLRRVEAVAGAKRRVLEIPDSQELRRRAFAALRELLTRLAEEQDVVLLLDDLQWGDVDSATLLAELLRPPRPPALLLIACYRAEETTTSPFLQKFLAAEKSSDGEDTHDVPVGGLTDVEARRLVLLLLPEDEASESRVEEIARESGGNPFLLSELARFGLAGVDPDERSSSGSRETPGALERVVRSRVERLPKTARRILEILSVAGRPLKRGMATRAAGLEESEEELAQLRGAHLIRTRISENRDEIEPYHDRIRETVVASLTAETLRSHHRRLALALEGSGTTDPEALALHFQEAGEVERAAEYAAAAASRAFDALAFDRASRLYRLAIELVPREPARTRALFVKLGDALSNAGHGAEAAEAYLAAARGAPAAEDLELRRRAAEQLLSGGHIERGLAALRGVLDAVGLPMPQTPRAALLSLVWLRAWIRIRGTAYRVRDATQVSAEKLTRIDVCWSAAKGLILSEPIRGRVFLARQLLLALRAGERFRLARSLAMEIGDSAMSGGETRRKTQKLVERATALADEIQHPYAIGFTMSVAGVAAYLEGRWKAARDLTDRAGVFLRDHCLGVWWELDNSQYYSLLVLYYLGEIQRLQETLPGVLKQAEDRGDLYAATNIRTRISYLTLLAQDQPQRAREELQAAIAPWSGTAFRLQHWYELFGQVECSLYSGEGEAAWRHLEPRWPALKRSLMLRVQSVRIHSLLLRARSAIAAAAEAGGENRGLLAVAERDVRRIERERMPWGNALALMQRAGIASVRGDREETARHLARAAEELEAADMSLHAVVARRRKGEFSGGERGRSEVRAADDWMTGQDIRNPDRMAAMLAPGIWPRAVENGRRVPG
jgi:serine/threonine protein kinase